VLESDRRLTIVPRLVLGTLLVHSPSSRICRYYCVGYYSNCSSSV